MIPRGSRVRMGVAAGVLLLGVGLLWRGLGHSRPKGLLRTNRTSAATPTVATPDITLEVAPGEIGIEESLQYTRTRIEELAEHTDAHPLTAKNASLLAHEATEYFSALLGGDPEAYAQYVRDRGGTLPDWVEGDRPQPVQARIDDQFRAFHMSPFSLAGMDVRARVIDGEYLEADSFGFKGISGTYPKYRQYPALHGLARETPSGWEITGDTYEVLIPIRHRYSTVESDVILGLWFTWSEQTGDWIISQVSIYGPQTVIIVPPT